MVAAPAATERDVAAAAAAAEAIRRSPDGGGEGGSKARGHPATYSATSHCASMSHSARADTLISADCGRVRWISYVGHRAWDIVLILATYPVAALDVTVRNENQN